MDGWYTDGSVDRCHEMMEQVMAINFLARRSDGAKNSKRVAAESEGVISK